MTSTSDDGRLDPAVVAGLYFENADRLRTFLVGVLRNGDLAAEALQATFVKAMESGHTARDQSLKAWLFRVAYNEAMLLRRRASRDNKSLRKLAWTRTGAHDQPEDNLTRFEDVARVKQALAELPQEQYEVVRKRIYEDKTFATIAEETGVPLGTVLTRMRLALRKLQQRFGHSDER